MTQDWKNCNGVCRLCINNHCPFRKEPMLGTNEETKKILKLISWATLFARIRHTHIMQL
jgi:hypothetical protein